MDDEFDDFDEYEEFEEFEELDLQEMHDNSLRLLKKADLRPSGTWGLTVHIAQATHAFELCKEALKNIMCVIYDLSRSNDPQVKVTALRAFVELQIACLDAVMDRLIMDIEDPESDFHRPQRREMTTVLNAMYNDMQEGVSAYDAYVDALERHVSDPKQRERMINAAGPASRIYAKHKDTIGPIINGIEDEEDNDTK